MDSVALWWLAGERGREKPLLPLGWECEVASVDSAAGEMCVRSITMVFLPSRVSHTVTRPPPRLHQTRDGPPSSFSSSSAWWLFFHRFAFLLCRRFLHFLYQRRRRQQQRPDGTHSLLSFSVQSADFSLGYGQSSYCTVRVAQPHDVAFGFDGHGGESGG